MNNVHMNSIGNVPYLVYNLYLQTGRSALHWALMPAPPGPEQQPTCNMYNAQEVIRLVRLYNNSVRSMLCMGIYIEIVHGARRAADLQHVQRTRGYQTGSCRYRVMRATGRVQRTESDLSI